MTPPADRHPPRPDVAAPPAAPTATGDRESPGPVVACWASKGGAGTTVIAATLALRRAQHFPDGAVLVDFAGDAPAVLGVPDPMAPGLAEWLRAGGKGTLPGLAVAPALLLVPRGAGPLNASAAGTLSGLLGRDGRPVVVDCGTVPQGVAAHMAQRADESLLVTRSCYLALRRVVSQPLPRPTGVILIHEPGRVLSAEDVATAVGAPVVAEITLDPAVARAVDAGLLASRLPPSLDAGLGTTFAAFGTPQDAARASSASLAVSPPPDEPEVSAS